MKETRCMTELIWKNPPKFNFGLYVAHTEWRWFIMRRSSTGLLVARQLYHGTIENMAQKLYMSNFVIHLTEFVRQMLQEVELVSPKSQEEVLERYRQCTPASKTKSKNTTKTTSNPTSTGTQSKPSGNDTQGEKKGPRGVRNEGKENKSPNYESKTFGQRNLALSSVSSNLIVLRCRFAK
jgi:hypothetical protein